jgi:hypothetical protein
MPSSRHDRHADGFHDARALTLSPIWSMTFGYDEDNAFVLTALGKLGVFGEKTVTRCTVCRLLLQT